MNLEIEETGPVERLLKIEVGTAEVDAAFDHAYRTIQRETRVKGFRPGKAPRSVLERYFSDRARSDVQERLIQETLPKAVAESELDLVVEPGLEPGELPEQGAAYAYEARIEIRPEIELVKIRGLEVTRPEIPEAEEGAVDAQLEQLRNVHASVSEEEEETPAAQGHMATVDYEGTLDGEPFEGGSARDVVIELGSGHAMPGFEDELLGLGIGQEKEFEITFPDDFPVEERRGKTASFKVKLNGLKRRELPDLDDEFAKDVSEFETLDEFKSSLEERMQSGRDAEAERQLREAVLDALVEANPFPVPTGLVERQLSQRLMQAMQQLQQFPPDQLMPMIERFREEWRERAERDVRLSFLLSEISGAEEISVSDEDAEERMRMIAEAEGQPFQVVQKAYKERGLEDALRASLVEERVVELLVSEASVSDG
jgi:trigger factor